MPTRRQFIKSASIAGCAIYQPAWLSAFGTLSKRGIYCQQYPWFTFFQRQGKDWNADLEYSISQFSKAGFTGFEPLLNNAQEVKALKPILDEHQVSMISAYVNSVLHEADQTESSISEVLEIAQAAKAVGVEILVTNPSPIRWGGDEDKTDQQLIVQAQALDQLGEKLREMGLTLAYHTHDAEMRNSAREFHHMMRATDPDNVKFCLDSHWIYRGSGDSQVALFDIVDMYADRIVELHLRQSKSGIWTEVFEPGDIDHERLAATLKKYNISPHIVLEQAVEEGSPSTLDAVEAHKMGLGYVKEVFKA